MVFASLSLSLSPPPPPHPAQVVTYPTPPLPLETGLCRWHPSRTSIRARLLHMNPKWVEAQSTQAHHQAYEVRHTRTAPKKQANKRVVSAGNSPLKKILLLLLLVLPTPSLPLLHRPVRKGRCVPVHRGPRASLCIQEYQVFLLPINKPL
jgi:hypothetical protein